MKRIFLRKISLLNFKGIRSLEVYFNEQGATTVRGRNHSGKTTLFDAFTWLLFGKDSQDNKKFYLRTLDEDGKVIPKIPHEVSCVLSIDGEEVTLRRCFVEKWVKKKGALEEEYQGNEEERYYNDVPCKKTEYDAKIEAICPERIFKYITNPLHFCTQKTDDQRKLLFKMAGGIKDEDIARGNKTFENLIASLNGKSLEEYQREIAVKKKRVKEDIRDIPARVDEIERNKPAEEDWDAIRAEIAAKQSRMDELEQLITAAASGMPNKGNRYAPLFELSELEKQLSARESELRTKFYDEENRIRERLCKFDAEMSAKRAELNAKNNSIATYKGLLTRLEEDRKKLLAEWKEIKSRELVFSDDEFVCPTCHRPFDDADVEAKKQELTENFNRKNAADIEDNMKRGKAVKAQIDEFTKQLVELEREYVKIDMEIKKAVPPVSVNPYADQDVTKDMEYSRIAAEIEKKKAEMDAAAKAEPTTADLYKREKTNLLVEVTMLNRRLAVLDQIKGLEARKEELENTLRQQSAELAQLEGIEYIIQQFLKAKVEAIEEHVNGLFRYVKFKLFDTQINGQEVETCECMLNNTPYAGLSLSERVNSGLDVINAICRYVGITAPIIIDNRESISSIIATESQVINLMVDEACETLTIH